MVERRIIGIICSVDLDGKITQAHCFEDSAYHGKMQEDGRIGGTEVVFISPYYIKEVFYSGLGNPEGFDVQLVESRRIR